MDWDAYKDFNFNSNEFNSKLGADFDKAASPDWLSGSFDKAYKTDWNKDFTKNTEGAKGQDKALEFLDRFKKGLSGFDGYGSQKPYSFGGGGGGFNAVPIGSDIVALQSGGGQTHFFPGQKGFGSPIGSLLGTAASFIPGVGPGIAAALPSIGGTVGGMFG